MRNMKAETTVVLDGYTYLECPRWHEGRIWVSDFYSHRVVSADETGSNVRIEAQVPNQPSGLGWLPDGRLLIVSMRDRKLLLRENDGSLTVHADLSTYASANLNDMSVDAQGRAYIGNFGFDLMNFAAIETADLVRVDPDGSAHVVASDLYFPNGMAFTDSNELLVDETVANRISAFDIAEDGSLGERRDWAKFGDPPVSTDMAEVIGDAKVAADGCCIDTDGTLWVADALGQRVLHVKQGGEILDQLDFETGVFACGLGGSDGRTLFVCAAPDFNEHQRKIETEGRLLAVKV